MSLELKKQFPKLTPEAVILFIILASRGDTSLPELVALAAMTEADVKGHLLMLIPVAGAGLVEIKQKDASKIIRLTPLGKTKAQHFNA